MIDQRFFVAPVDVYEAARAHLDRLMGFPDYRAETAIEPAETAPRDPAGLVLLAVHSPSCDLPPLASVIADAVLAGAVEIDEATYMAATRADSLMEGS